MKTPPPLNSVAKERAAAALGAGTAALGDADAGVRPAAAKVSSRFITPLPAASAKPIPCGAESIRSGEKAIRSDEERIRSDEETIRSGEEAILSGDEAILSGDEAIQSGDEAIQSGDEATSGSLQGGAGTAQAIKRGTLGAPGKARKRSHKPPGLMPGLQPEDFADLPADGAMLK